MGASHVVVGLGNPGPEYEGTRHNVGFMVVERLAGRLEAGPIDGRRYGAKVASARIGGHDVLMVLPQDYMNRSGDAVRKAVNDVGLPPEAWPERLIVVHDELDLPLGRLKLQSGRGAGGHNGIRSIVAALGTNDFARVRVGIDKPPKGWGTSGADWVLSRFPKGERTAVEAAVVRAAEAVEAIVTRGLQVAGNEFNVAVT